MVCDKILLPREMIGRMESLYSYREMDETHSDGDLLRVLRVCLRLLNVRHMVLLVSMFWGRLWAAQSDAGEQEAQIIRRFRGPQMQN